MPRRILASAAAVIVFALPIVAEAQSTSSTYQDSSGSTYSSSTHSSRASHLAKFKTEDAAKEHCPSDTVVWLNTRKGILHMSSDPYYGKTKHGAYVCEQEARNAGDRAPRKSAK